MTEKKVVVVDKKVNTGVVRVVESAVPDAADGKILAVRAEAHATSCDALTDEFRVGVKTTFYALVLTDSGTYERRATTAETVRSVSQQGIDGTTKSSFAVDVNKCYYDASEGKLVAEETVRGQYILPGQISIATPSEDLVCRLSDQKTVREDLNKSNLYLTQSDEMRMPVKSVADCSATVVVTDCYPSAGAFRLDGEITLRVVAVSDNDQFFTQTFSHPFGTDVVCECDGDVKTDVECLVTRCDVSLSDGNPRGILTDLELTFLTTLGYESETTVMTDCYSVDYDCSAQTEAATYDASFCSRTVSDRSTAVLNTGAVVNEVYACLGPVVKTLSAVNDNGILVEGVLTATVLYADENNLPASRSLDIPVSLKIDGAYGCSSDLRPTLTVKGIGARLKTGTDIEVSAEYDVKVRGTDEKTLSCVTEVTLGAPKEPDDIAISLYLTRPGEDLFDVAKSLGVKEETLLSLNPDLTLPLTGGEKILMYSELSLPEE
ncbi:MAG: DUF3794 domain-containing protein [Clostridia bacterium]|nr:DUF3794 domain-containing protein [Clostridia bacterium]